MHPSAFRFDGYELIPATRELRRAGARVALPPRAFLCLVMLVEHRDRVLGRDELIGALWPRGSATDVQLGQLILQCRRAIDDDGQTQRAIRTVAGFGYRWVAATTVLDGDAITAPNDPVATAHAPAPTDPLPAPEDTTAIAAIPFEAETIAPARARRGLAATDRPSRLLPVLLLAALLGLIAIGILWQRHRANTPRAAPTAARVANAERLIVLPLQSADGDGAWIRLGGMDLIGDRLRRGGLAVLPSDTTVSLLHGLGADVAAPPPQATIEALRTAADARRVVDATLEQTDKRWRARVVAIASDGSRAVGQFDDASPVVALRNAADRLVAALGHVPAPSKDTATVAETLQRARAAMLANEPDAARAILLANPELVRDTPRLRQQLADVDIRAGRSQDARIALDALLADTPQPSPFRAELLAARGTVAVRSGEFALTGQLATEAIDMRVDAGDPILRGRLHLMRGVSRISLQDYAGALVDNGIARDAFLRAGDAGSVARVDGNLGVLELLRGHPAQAAPYLERAIAQFEELGIRQEPIGNLQMLYVARRQQLDLARAMAAIERAWSQRDSIRSPDSQLSVRLYRAQGLLRVGRLAEASGLLDDPANDRVPADPADAERLALLRATLAFQRGRADEALALLADVPETELASADSDTPRADAAVLRSRLQRVLRQSDAPAENVAIDAALPADANPRLPWRLLASANRAATAGDTKRADILYQRALVLADAQGVAETISGIIADYVVFLIDSGRIADAAAIASRGALWTAGDFESALTDLRIAHAKADRGLWQTALQHARALSGERAIPAALAEAPPPPRS